jgi:hypothetical protein
LLDCGWRCARRPVEAALTTLAEGVRQVDWLCGAGPLLIFLPDARWCSTLRNLAKHSLLPTSSLITDRLDSFLLAPSSSVTFLVYSPKWVLPDNADYTSQMVAAQSATTPLPPGPREQAISDWQSEYPPAHLLSRTFGHAWHAVTCPDGTGPPPFVMGVLRTCDRRLFSACIRALTRHTFTADYSVRFRPSANDELVCPCHRAGVDRELGPPGSVDGESSVQPGALDGESAPGSIDRERAPPLAFTLLHLIHHSTANACPLVAPLRSSILCNSSLDFIFGTEDGGFRLATFIHMSQTLLRPLPPRPDPP